MNRLVCIVGMTGSGKTVLSEHFTKKGYQFVRFGQITLDVVIKKGIKPTEENERKIREDVRKKHGMAAFAILNYSKFTKLLKKENVVADGLYSWSEYKYLKKKFGKRMTVVATYAPPNIRYERLAKRINKSSDKKLAYRKASHKQAKNRDYAEIENIEKGGPIAMADYTILNTGTLEEFKKEIEKVYRKIEGLL